MTEAAKILRSLVEFIFEHPDGLITTMTYQDLAGRIGRLDRHGRPHAHGMGHVLGEMGHMLLDLDLAWNESVPHIQSLVVNKTGPLRGLPDEGIREFWPEYPSLSFAEKSAKTRVEHSRILAFGSRWNEVLEKLGLEPVLRSQDEPIHPERRFGKGGESPAHRKLKRFVKDHPSLFGAAEGGWEAIEEYALPSLDSIDVLFKSPDRWIAAEVKSRVSDGFPGDYERGVYQAVKYRALISAMAQDPTYRAPSCIDSILVLESSLPGPLKMLANNQGITIYEGIKAEE